MNGILKTSVLILVFLISILNLKAQTTEAFSAGYYIINSTAQYAVVMPSGHDYYQNENYSNSYDACADSSASDEYQAPCYYRAENLRMAIGEVVYVFEFSKGKYYCYDPNGRMVVFQGANCLTKASVVTGAGVGKMEESIQILGGEYLGKRCLLLDNWSRFV